jgi:DNA-binding response OmpR family regulator/S1-C subfamily serine protease
MPASETILIASGDSAPAERLQHLLHQAGYRALVASSLAEIHAAVHTQHIDVLLLAAAATYALDPCALVAELKGSAATSATRIVVLGADEAHESVRWLDMGADDTLPAAAQPAELLARIRTQLRAARQLAQSQDKARLAEEGQKIAHTAFEALAVTEKMTKDAFSLDRRLRTGLSVLLVVAALMAVGFLVFSRMASRESERAYAAIRRLETTIASESELMTRVARMRSEIERSTETALSEHRQKLETQSEEIRTRMTSAGSEEVSSLRKQLDETNTHLRRIESEGKIAQSIIRSYTPSVCLLHVAVSFRHQATGRRLRYAGLNPRGEPLQDSEGNPVFDLEGSGPEVRADFFGTGFLAAADGRILTNRHVVEPWWKNDDMKGITAEGFEPVISEMSAYFPDSLRGLRVQAHRISPTTDVALVKGDLTGLKRPVIALDVGKGAAVSGQPVILMGYATGLDAILARAGEEAVRSIVAAANGNPREIMAEVARRNLIRPLTTQGHLGDVLADRIVYDAQTTHGGSGGPLFNAQGRVIAVNFAVVRGFGGSNFGIPARFAQQLLK